MDCGDGGLHVLRRAVDAAVEVELQRDLRAAEELVDVIESMPAMLESCCSSGVATDAAIVSGLAPGRLAEIEIVGKSTLGSSLTGSLS